MDIFGNRRIAQLEKEICYKDEQIESLKRDLLEVERQLSDMKKKHEPAPVGTFILRSSASYSSSGNSTDARQHKKERALHKTEVRENDTGNLGASLGIGLGVASIALSSGESCSENNGD